MKVTRKSLISGVERTREIDVTDEQLRRWQAGEVAQNAMPHLSDSDREFVMTGITDDEWATLVPDEDDEPGDGEPAF